MDTRNTVHNVSGVIPTWTLGDRLAKARTQAGMNQDEMANLLGVSRRTVTRLETDQHHPSQAVLVAWAYFTGVSMAWILGDTLEKQPSGWIGELALQPA